LDERTTIRRATPLDLPAIHAIEQSSFATPGERFGHRTIRTLIRNPRAVTFVAETDGRVAAWVVGYCWLRGPHPWGRVYSLAVLPEAQGRKLGSSLLRRVIDEMRGRGAVSIFLEVRFDNHDARRLYERFGFTHHQHLPDFFGPGLPAHRMRIEL
jgi:ribosomal-protein-alanine N-acetyltransferase